MIGAMLVDWVRPKRLMIIMLLIVRLLSYEYLKLTKYRTTRSKPYCAYMSQDHLTRSQQADATTPSGFFMSGFYTQLTKHIAGFTVMYGLFLSFGEAGPGNCLGLLASKRWPTAIRGQACAPSSTPARSYTH